MPKTYIHIKYFGALVILILNVFVLYAQDTTSKANKLLFRDSLDFNDNKLTINTTANEFSPVPYKGGLLFISNKPIKGQHVIFNKVYWVPDSVLSNNKLITNDVLNAKKFNLSHDFTPSTSNDNDILYNYRRIKKRTNSNNVEYFFSEFTTDQAFTYNDSAKIIIYSKKSKPIFGKLSKRELWQAKIVDGRLFNNTSIIFDGDAADYLYPYISEHADTLFFSSNRKESLGGFDIFYVKREGDSWGTIPIPVELVNSDADELSPTKIHDTLLFASNRSGGLGGFDVYGILLNTKRVVENLGYPLNSAGDDLSLHKFNNNYFLTTNRNGNFDILGVNHIPIYYQISGVLKYKNDSALASNHLMYIKDVETDYIIDTLMTDSLARYHFVAKPNRTYQASIINIDKQFESITIKTYPNQKSFEYVSNLYGRSNRQIKDSIQAMNIMAEAKLKDSIISNDIRLKYIVRYGFDKNVLTDKEKLVLDSLIIRLSKMPKTFVIIGAFTDCTGSYKYNYQLSVKRAKYVVDYLVKNGLSIDRIVSNGYSKKYTLTPCVTKYAFTNQRDSRRAEIILSDTKNTNWASLNEQYGDKYYTHLNSNTFKYDNKQIVIKDVSAIKNNIKSYATIKPAIITNKVKLQAEAIIKRTPSLFNKGEKLRQDSLRVILAAKAKLELFEKQKAKVQELIAAKEASIKDSIKKAAIEAVLIAKKELLNKEKFAKLKQDSIKNSLVIKAKLALLAKLEAQKVAQKLAQEKVNERAMLAAQTIKLKDSIAKAKAKAQLDLIAQVKASKKRVKDSLSSNLSKSISSITTDLVEEDLTKEEILKSLDVLAKLKLEQERIVEYLTKRINKKPIFIFVTSDTVAIEIYDNGIHDKDSVSVIYNNRIVVDREELKVNKPIKFKLKVDKVAKNNELVFVAENLGSEPPNTGVMFITEKTGRRQQVILSTDMTHNEVIYLIRIEKQ